MTLDLIRDQDGGVLGVTALRMKTGGIYILGVRMTLFAAGGAGRVHATSTSAFTNTGDGLGTTARVGVPLEGTEFWQPHPTGMADAGMLITEDIHGGGGILRDKDDERFMEHYAPALKNLAPCNFVSHPMDQKIKKSHGYGPSGDYVLLDSTCVGAETIMKHLLSIREIGLKFVNVGAIKEPIPVIPTIHYQIGGIPTNYRGQVVVSKSGNPNEIIDGFYAADECSCTSVYGTNHLDMNSLLDLVVFSRSAGDYITTQNLKGYEYRPLPADTADRALSRLARLDPSSSGEYMQDVANDIRRSMQSYISVFHTQKLIDKGVEHILGVAEHTGNIYLKDKSRVFNTTHVEALEVANLVEVVKAMMVPAAAHKESHDAYAHNDFPNRNSENWMKRSL